MLRSGWIALAMGAGLVGVLLPQSHTNIQSIVQCKLLSLQGSTLHCSAEGRSHVLPLAAGVRVWKGKEHGDTDSLRNGDLLDIRLEPTRDGNHVATYIWANLVKYEGLIGSSAGNRVELFPFSPRTASTSNSSPVVFVLDNDTEFARGRTPADLEPKRPAIMVGLLLDNGTVQATRIILSGK